MKTPKTPAEQLIELIEQGGVKRTKLAKESGLSEPTFRARLKDNKWKSVTLMRLKVAGRIKWLVPRNLDAKALMAQVLKPRRKSKAK